MFKLKMQIQNIKNNIQIHMVEYSGILLTAFILFSIIWPIILGADDDIMTYIITRKGGLIATAISAAEAQGRFWFLISGPISYFPLIFNNFTVYKLISYCSICFSVAALGVLLYRNISKEIAFLSSLLFFTFIQLDGEHNLLVSYVLSHQITIGLVLFSIERMLAYYKEERQRDLILSAFLLLLSCIIYESFILYIAFIFLISLLYNRKKSERVLLKFKLSFIDLRYHILLIAIYIGIYFTWRSFYPGTYEGAQFHLTSIIDSLRVIFTYGFGSFPLVSTFHHFQNYNLEMIEPIFIIKGIFASIVVLYILKKAEGLNRRTALYGLYFSGLGLLLPALLHSVTSKYILWVKSGSYIYLPSFYSYFFIISFLSILIITIYQRTNRYKIKLLYLALLFTIVFAGSILTDINNKLETDKYQIREEKYKVFDNAISSEYFLNIENGATIYVPDYNGINNYMPYLDYYASQYSNRQHVFTNKVEDLTFNNPTYGFKYDEDSGCMLIGALKKNMLSDNICVVSDGPLSNMSLILYKTGGGNISINGTNEAFSGNIDIIPLQSYGSSIKLSGNDMDLFSSSIVNEVLQSKASQFLILGDGFYSKEMWGNDTAYWSENTSKIELLNKLNQERKIRLTAKIATGNNEKQYSLEFAGNEIRKVIPINATQQNISLEFYLKPGVNEFTFSCNAPPLEQIGEDKRNLVFYVINLNMEFINE